MRFTTIVAASILATSASAADYEGWLWFAKAGDCPLEAVDDPNMQLGYPSDDGGTFCVEVTYDSPNYGLILDMTDTGGNFPPKYVRGCLDSACKQCGEPVDIIQGTNGISTDCSQFTNSPYVYIGDS
ncbi:hypothetical protein N7456_008080 [Penicillium angulare]|uniref:Uncharacterized protein n=1 Tax=Penicillium angulare TaxID=116970 RepID=A0A9W9FBY7_9EURO|nr:hypothetical protein N7456_008080 [Penicillium angulare]